MPRKAVLSVIAMAAILAVVLIIVRMSRRELASAPPRAPIKLALSRTEATNGDTFGIKITELAGHQIWISYSLDNGPKAEVGLQLASDGTTSLEVSPTTRRGTYRLLAVHTEDSPWISLDGTPSITVH